MGRALKRLRVSSKIEAGGKINDHESKDKGKYLLKRAQTAYVSPACPHTHDLPDLVPQR